jgi:Protein of unknown function (DUF3892)
MPKYIKAEAAPNKSVLYYTDDGTRFLFSGGDPAWRNQNPGNLVPGNVSARNGAIGKAGKFAVFPTREAGHAALLDSLKNVHGEKSLAGMIGRYAPKKENKTAKYLKFLKKQTGVKDQKKINDFTPQEFEKLWRAIEKYEGGKQGSITELPPKKQIDGVRKNKKGTITAYHIEGMGWLSKPEAIRLTKSGEIDAVVATSRSGNPFLRTRPDVIVENNLEKLG